MRHWLKMYDRLTLNRAAIEKAIKCTDESGDNPSLLVHVAASHSGYVNGNRRMYRPDYMQQDVHTFVPKGEFAKPVLIGHDEKGQVLGRVREAKYVDESWKYATDFPILRDTIFYSRDAKKHSLYKTVDWITDNLMPLADYSGLGYIDLGLQITNPEAVRKFLSEEYLTVSVGFKTDSAICSICHQDWAVDDRCEHRLGEMVDGKEMFLISGHFDYEEVSVVNFPADPFATTLSKKKLVDSLEKIFFLGLPVQKQRDAVSSGLTMTDSLYDADINPTYEDSMANTVQFDNKAARTKIEATDLTAEQAFELKDQISAWEPTADADKTEKRSLTSTITAKIRKNGWTKDAAPAVSAEEAAEIAEAVDSVNNPKVVSDTTGQVKDAALVETPVVETPVAEVTVGLSARVQKALDSFKSDKRMKDSTGNEVADLITSLDKGYDSLPDDIKWQARMAVRAMVDDWCADGEMAMWLQGLAAAQDSVLIKKSDLAEKEDAIVDLSKDVDELKSKVNAAEAKTATILRDSKRNLATQIVMYRVIKGADGYKSLDTTQVKSKVEELSKRNVISLKDSVQDILAEIKWSEPAKAAAAEVTEVADTKTPTPNPTEEQPTVNKDEQISEKDATTLMTDSAPEAGEVQRDIASLNRKLAFMNPAEREVALADFRFSRRRTAQNQ
jgi:hypothetical protein